MANVNTVVASSAAEVDLMSGIWTAFMSAHTEILLFVAAVIAYFALFMQRTPKSARMPKKKLKVVEEDCKEEEYPTDSTCVDPKDYETLPKSMVDAFESGDYRLVLKCWNAMKKMEQMPSVSLPQVVESMQRFKKDSSFILKELKAFLQKLEAEKHMKSINDLLESLAKRMDSDMMEKIAEMLPEMNLDMDECSYEIFLNMYFTTRGFQEVSGLVAQMKAKNINFTPRASAVVIKTALKTGNFEEAVQHFRDLKQSWSSQSLAATASTAPTQIVSQLVELACREHKLNDFLAELQGAPVSEESVNIMLQECVRQKDVSMTAAVEKLARDTDVAFTDATYGLLIHGFSADGVRVKALFEEVLEKGIEISTELAASIIVYCSQTSNVQLADKLYAHMKPSQPVVLSAFIRFYADCEEFEKACDVYEKDLVPVQSQEARTLQTDARMERSLMNAALKCGRPHLAKNLLSSSPSDVAKHITMIRNFAAEKNLQGAVSVFDQLEKSGVDMNSIIYNTVLDACVECHDIKAAEAWMEQTQKVGMADVVSYNTLMKAHLQNGNFFKARFVMQQMKDAELQPNRVTFNELINAIVTKGGHRERQQLADLLDEMKAADVKPNQVTVSILLKSLNSHSQEADIVKTMDLIDTMDEPMDEVLLSSVVEACVRIGKPALLEKQLSKLQQGDSAVAINGSHTYGSLIKAYGHAKDIKGIWRCWKEMRSRHIKPTSITLGCMVEAIVCNGDPEGAFDLIHQMQEDESCRSVVNSVIYCSVLKGFTRERKMDRALAVYEEIQKHNIELSIVMYNTLIDACARCGRMELLATILEDMKKHNVMPNLITYSTMLKGHCQCGDIQTAFSILQQMKEDAELKPDEIMYNSLLDGCAQNNMPDEGLKLLQEMRDSGVKPSNFTLSILVKLMNRARRLNQAFSIVEEITHQYNICPNVHVYTNLVQACVQNQQLAKGMNVLERMIKEQVSPDNRTYSILLRANISRGCYDDAAGLLRGALGLEGSLQFLRNKTAICQNLEHSLVNETLSGLADHGRAQELALPLLSAIKKDQATSWVRIDAATQRNVMSPSVSTSGASQRQGKGQGKGKNQGGWNRQQ